LIILKEDFDQTFSKSLMGNEIKITDEIIDRVIDDRNMQKK
jgi:hypothetical protein